MARILPNGSLLLPAIGIVDEGTFRCRAINRRGKEVKSNYRVRVYRKGPTALTKALLTYEKAFISPSPLTLGPGSHAWSVRNFKRQLLIGLSLQRFLGSQKLWMLPLNSQLVSLIRYRK